jgi:hypothetical protein
MWMVMGLVGCHAAIRVIWWMRGPRSAWLLPSACAACVRRRRRPLTFSARVGGHYHCDPSHLARMMCEWRCADGGSKCGGRLN